MITPDIDEDEPFVSIVPVIPLAIDRHDLTGHGLVRHDVSPDGEPSAEGWVRRLREQGQYSDVACRAGSALS